MYPNLYYAFKDWFGVEWQGLSFLNTFGLMVAMGFVTAAIVLSKELQRKEKEGLLSPREEMITVGKPASFTDLILNAFVGFIFGYKILGLFFNKPADMDPQDYIFSAQGNIVGGLVLAGLLTGFKWWEKNKQKLKEPERRNVRIWPHDRVGDIIILGLIFGIIGAKLFDNLENWSDFIKDPIGRLFSASGLTFYGGLILAAIAICWYASKKGIKVIHLVDAAGLALLLAYAVGRIGCQVSGDGDWGIYNSAYVVNAEGKVVEAGPGDYQAQLNKHASYYLKGEVYDKDSTLVQVTDRTYETLDQVPHRYMKAPSFLPVWMAAYTYPQNVNKDGVQMPGCTEEHCRALPQPVFPTPFYETVVCTLLFLILWSIRRRIKVPGVMFGIYLIVNGLERFTVELFRVNNTYSILGFHPTQAEIISALLILSGIILIIIVKRKAASRD
ncbi:MAG: prolipoprotein diacylglyceryl transferase [Chitinophagaceae bacterium]|nr:prolipoprotein diacylglyceryl transferase [Chitinophagaceae bacterium]MBK7559770.1 prolipoprotein diacylglyceryl transferase [Chitinophagaceae bacterium]MBK9530291.1 prolipoprotein diacylglyceryl transferase [Chitinophagaceae bacterium]